MKRLFLQPLILLASVLISPSWADAKPQAAYSAIIDAGSSGSRIYLYKAIRKGSAIQVEDLWGFEPKDVPGLSDFKEHPNEAYKAGVVPLLVPLRSFLGEKGLKETEVTVHVLATGGLRLLDPVQSHSILEAIGSGLKATEFSVGRIGILPSELEGLLAWADLNALLGRLAPGKETLGIVEIGGASAQIAYEVKGKALSASKVWPLQGRTYRILSRSFLGLGQNAARKAMIHSAGGGIDGNPCYPQGVSVADKKTGVDHLTGSFDAARCRGLYLDVIRQNPDFDQSLLGGAANQTFAGIGQGNPVGPIKGSISLWKLKGSNPHDSLKVIEAACRSPWSIFRVQFGEELVNQNQCANSIFIEALLYDPTALGMSANQVRHMEYAGGRVPSWTRGFLLLPETEFH